MTCYDCVRGDAGECLSFINTLQKITDLVIVVHFHSLIHEPMAPSVPAVHACLNVSIHPSVRPSVLPWVELFIQASIRESFH